MVDSAIIFHVLEERRLYILIITKRKEYLYYVYRNKNLKKRINKRIINIAIRKGNLYPMFVPSQIKRDIDYIRIHKTVDPNNISREIESNIKNFLYQWNNVIINSYIIKF